MSVKVDINSGTVFYDRTSEYWRDPVANAGGLPATGNRLDDIRVASDSGIIFKWNGTSWVPITTGSAVSLKVERVQLSAGDITNKYITLVQNPATAAQTVLIVKDGPGMYYGDDFTVGGSQLSWNGKELDGILAAGDKMTIMYQ